MFDVVRNNPKIAQAIIALIALPFAFVGVQSYLRSPGAEGEVAKVGGQAISQAEFDQALRKQQERLRAQFGGRLDQSLLNSPEVRQEALENLINQRLLGRFVSENHIVIGDQQLRDAIAAIPAFQQDGHFDMARYEQALIGQGMSQQQFEAALRRDLAFEQVVNSLSRTATMPRSVAERLLRAQLEERQVQSTVFLPADYLAKVKVEDSEVKAYYAANGARFERPARAKAEYLVLDETALEKQVILSDADKQKWYEAHKDAFGQAEERRASHILITVAADAPEAQVKKAHDKAAAILAQVKAKPDSFAEIAKKESQDPGSAAQGGDLGSFGRGAMVKPFEEAAFSLKQGELSELVRSDFGFHIIRVTEIHPATTKPYAQVAAEVESRMRKEAAGRRFAEQAESFSNMVYEQADSLDEVAKHFGLTLKSTDWLTADAPGIGELKDPKLVSALFSDDVLKQHHNSSAIDLGNNTLASVRALESQPAQRLAYDEVKAGIEKQLRTGKAAELAAKEGEAALAALREGKGQDLKWDGVRSIRRSDRGLPADAVKAVFALPADKLPGYAGGRRGDGSYFVLKLESVKAAEVAADDPRLKNSLAQFERMLGEQDFDDFLKSLRERYKVEVKAAALSTGRS